MPRRIFNTSFQITQKYGINPLSYKQYGLLGHEGIDLVPGDSNWLIYALEDGVVVLDDDIVGSVQSDPYGRVVTLWHQAINKATMYCHLLENYVVLGQKVKKGEIIARMGSTGNSTGPHLHLNLFDVDSSGNRLNRNNGFNGGIDPLPFLLEEPVIITDEMPPYLKGLLAENNLDLNNEGQIREFFGAAKDAPTLRKDLDNARKVVEDDGKAIVLLTTEITDLKERLKTTPTTANPVYSNPTATDLFNLISPYRIG